MQRGLHVLIDTVVLLLWQAGVREGELQGDVGTGISAGNASQAESGREQPQYLLFSSIPGIFALQVNEIRFYIEAGTNSPL